MTSYSRAKKITIAGFGALASAALILSGCSSNGDSGGAAENTTQALTQPQSQAPTFDRSFEVDGTDTASFISADHDGNILVSRSKGTRTANATTRVETYDRDAQGRTNVQPTATLDLQPGSGIHSARGLTTVGDGDTLIVGDDTGSVGSTAQFPAGATGGATVSRKLAGANTGLRAPRGVDTIANQYAVADSLTGKVSEWRWPMKGDRAPVWTSPDTNKGVYDVAYAIDGTLYASVPRANKIVVYKGGNQVREITSASPDFSPAGLDVDVSGNLVVAVPHKTQILAFSPTASGNATPIWEIAGPGSGLVNPQSLVVNGDLFVLNTASGSQAKVSVYEMPPVKYDAQPSRNPGGLDFNADSLNIIPQNTYYVLGYIVEYKKKADYDKNPNTRWTPWANPWPATQNVIDLGKYQTAAECEKVSFRCLRGRTGEHKVGDTYVYKVIARTTDGDKTFGPIVINR